MEQPHIILVMQSQKFEPIAFVEDLCVCNEEGNVAIFPDLRSAVNFRDDNAIDGRVVALPMY